MNRRTLMAVLAVVALGFVMSSTAEAGGGGGSKKNATIKVNNGQLAPNDPVGVIVLPGNKTPDPAWNTVAKFQAAGGKVVSAGQSVSFSVAPGFGNVWVINSDGAPAPVNSPYNVSTGKTYTYLILGTDAAPFFN